MVLAMCAHIVFPATAVRQRVEMRKVHAVTIEQSVDDLCQRAEVRTGRNVGKLQQQALKTYIRRGDPVEVYVGYDGNLNLEFEGYVEKVGAEIPVVITLRDSLWKLLQEPFKGSYSSTYIPTLAKDILGNRFTIDAMDATVNAIRFDPMTKAEALKAIRDEFGLVTYLKGGKVFVGKVFDAGARTATYDLERNVKSSSLTYRMAEDVKLRVTAKSLMRDGSTVTVEVGDPDGETRTLNYYGIKSTSELKKLAEHDMLKFKYDGFEGDFEGFGIPVCQFGDKVTLKSTLYPERDGDYLAEAVTTEFGRDGFSRTIKLAQQWTA